MTTSGPPPCRCGHPRVFHAHLNTGTYCGTCTRGVCPRYRRPSLYARLLDRLMPVRRRAIAEHRRLLEGDR